MRQKSGPCRSGTGRGAEPVYTGSHSILGIELGSLLAGVRFTDITPSVADVAFGKLAQVIGQDTFQKRVHISGTTQLANKLVNFVLKTRGS